MKEPMVTISEKEYKNLLDDQWKLECLLGCGVDNWSGYDDAMEMYQAEDEE